MDTPNDNTAIIRMKQDFDDFIAVCSRGSRPEFDQDTSISDKSGSRLKGTGGVTMQAVLEKQKQDQLTKAALITAQSKVAQLETQVSSLETKRKRARSEYERDMEDIKTQHQREVEKYEELKNQLHYVSEREKLLREELQECQERQSQTKKGYEQKLHTLQKDKLRLESTLEEAQESSGSKIKDLSNQLMRQQTETKICKMELDETKEKLQMYMKRYAAANTQMQELEAAQLSALTANQRVKELEEKLTRLDDDQVVTKALKNQLQQVPEMEKEIRKLRDDNKYYRETNENNYLLKEQMTDLKQKLERAEQRCADMAKVEVENKGNLHKDSYKAAGRVEILAQIALRVKIRTSDKHTSDLKSKLLQWETEIGGIKSPSMLTKRIADLQSSQAVLLEKQGTLQTSAHFSEDKLRAAEEKYRHLSTQLLQEQQKNSQQMELVKRLQRKLLLITKEKDGFKRIIESYEHEVTVNVGSQSNTRLQQMDILVQGYQKQAEANEAQVNQLTEELGRYRIKCQELEFQASQAEQARQRKPSATSEVDQKIILQLREKVAELEKELEKISEEKEILEDRIEQRNLQGDYDPTKTKVLHFTMNPAALAQKQRAEEIKKLQTENKMLKERIKLLETSGGHFEGMTEKIQYNVQQPSTSSEVAGVKAQLNSAELKNKRLMEAFKKTSQEFRQVVYLLTGYKIDIPCANQYRLMSMYAESPEDFLMFQQSSDGEMQLLETEYSSTLQHLIETYLQNQDSIPAFLSSHTLDLMSRQTVRL